MRSAAADRIEVRDRVDPRRGIGRVVLRAQHAGAARVLEEPLRIAHPRAQRRGRRERRDAAHAFVVGGGDDRERATEPEPGDPHAGDVGPRVQRVDRGAHVGEPALDREVALRRSGAAEREREAGPSRLPARSGRTGSGRCCRRVAAPPATAWKPGEHQQTGNPCHAGRAREMRAQPQPLRDDLFHRGGYPGPRDRLDDEPDRHRTPALKEWAAIVHALLEGEQIVDVRKGGLREDGRHFDSPARRFWLSPTAEHQKTELLKPAYAHWIDLAYGVAGRRADHDPGLGRRRRRRDDHRARAARRARLQDRSGSRLRRVTVQLEAPRPAVGPRAARAPARRAAHGRRGATSTAAARRGSPTTACPPTRPPCRRKHVLSDVAFEAKHKGIREALGEQTVCDVTTPRGRSRCKRGSGAVRAVPAVAGLGERVGTEARGTSRRRAPRRRPP